MYSKANSYRRNHKARVTQFKRGNKCSMIYHAQRSELPDSHPDSEDSPVITRPCVEEYQDACQIAGRDEAVNQRLVCPAKLRPAMKTKNNDPTCDLTSKEENIIVNFSKLSALVAGFIHQCDSPSPIIQIVKRQGLCITAETSCNYCNFTSTASELFTTIKKSRGPEAVSLNDALAIAVLKSKMGISDVRYLLSCINVQPPAPSGLHKKLCDTADKMVQLNTDSMEENQMYVRRVMQMAGKSPEVNLETDLSFNNRPQSGYEAATQSFCPMVEQDTNKKLVLSMATANKLCFKKACDHKNSNCRKNYGIAESISSSESKLVRKNLEHIKNSGMLKVKSVTSDASAQIDKSLRNYAQDTNQNIQHYKCFVHKLCIVQKHIRYTRLTSTLAGCDKDIYSLRLSTAVRA